MGKIINENSLKNFVRERVDEKVSRRFKTIDDDYKKVWGHIAKLQEDISIILAKLKEMGEKK